MIIDSHGHVGLHNIPGHYRDEDIEAVYKRLGICKGVFSSMVSFIGELKKGNAGMIDFIKRYDFAYGLVVVTPTLVEDSLSEMNKYLGGEKILGIKFHANYSGTAIDDSKMRPILDAFHPYGFTMLVHCDHVDPNAHPRHIGNIASEYPNTKFIIAHHACDAWEGTCEVMRKHENVYTDIVASWSEYDVIAKIISRTGEDRLLYGSDINLFDPAAFIGCVLSSEVSDTVKEKIFYHNARKLFGF